MTKDEALTSLSNLIDRIDTQDRRATAKNILYMIKHKRFHFTPHVCGMDGGYWRIEHDCESPIVEASSADEAKEILSKQYDIEDIEIESLMECDRFEYDQFAGNAFLTKDGLDRHKRQLNVRACLWDRML